MNTSHGKYDGPLSALADRWSLDGDQGDDSYTDDVNGEGTYLYRGPFVLTYRDARYLIDEHEATTEDLDLLADELSTAAGIVFSWDSQGFLYAGALRWPQDVSDEVARLDKLNEAASEVEA